MATNKIINILMRCPECGSVRLIKFGKKFVKNLQMGRRYLVQQYQCKECGRITIHPEQMPMDGRR